MSADHGTNSAYHRHLKIGEEPCDRCRAANADYSREYRRENFIQPRVAAIRVEAIRECLQLLDGLHKVDPATGRCCLGNDHGHNMLVIAWLAMAKKLDSDGAS